MTPERKIFRLQLGATLAMMSAIAVVALTESTAVGIGITASSLYMDLSRSLRAAWKTESANRGKYAAMVGKVYRTPLEPSGLVRVVAIAGLLHGRTVVDVTFEENHPAGYLAGSEGSYLADELKDWAEPDESND